MQTQGNSWMREWATSLPVGGSARLMTSPSLSILDARRDCNGGRPLGSMVEQYWFRAGAKFTTRCKSGSFEIERRRCYENRRFTNDGKSSNYPGSSRGMGPPSLNGSRKTVSVVVKDAGSEADAAALVNKITRRGERAIAAKADASRKAGRWFGSSKSPEKNSEESTSWSTSRHHAAVERATTDDTVCDRQIAGQSEREHSTDCERQPNASHGGAHHQLLHGL